MANVKVFLSYAEQDAELASSIGDLLRKKGLDVFDPQREVFPGDNWALEMGKALERSNAMLIVLTPHYGRSWTAMQDLMFAVGDLKYKDKVVPVLPPGRSFPLDAPSVLKKLRLVQLDSELPDLGVDRIANVFEEAA